MNKKKETYKEAISEIEEILAQIENNELDVDELSEKVKRVSLLIKTLRKRSKKSSGKWITIERSSNTIIIRVGAGAAVVIPKIFVEYQALGPCIFLVGQKVYNVALQRCCKKSHG